MDLDRRVNLVLCCLALSACGGTSSQTVTPAPQTATLAPDTARNRKPPNESTYQALGYLEEYTGRFVAHDSDRVERFYVNEKDVAKSFRALLSRVARDEGLEDDVREEWQDGLVTFHSAGIAALLNAMYLERRPGSLSELRDGTMVPNYELFVTPEMFTGVDRPRKLAYLAGVYRRHGHGRYIVFSNAAHKAALVAQLLREEHCEAVAIESVTNTIPNSNVVTFSGCVELTRTLRSDVYNGPRSDR